MGRQESDIASVRSTPRIGQSPRHKTPGRWTESLAAAVALAALASPSPGATFGAPASDPADGMQSMKLRSALTRLDTPADIRRVRFILVPPHSEHWVELTEQTLDEQGCAYETTDAASITNLATQLREGGLMTRKATVERALERMVTFELRDGTSLRFAFSESFDSDAVLPGSSAHEPLTASRALGDGLLRWAARLGQSTKCSYFVDRPR